MFDIVCNCVMFALLVSEGVCISKQAFDCQLWKGEAFLVEFSERPRSLDMDGTERRISIADSVSSFCALTEVVL